MMSNAHGKWSTAASLAVAVIFIMAPAEAKPKLDESGRCIIPAHCKSDTLNSACAKYYCRGLRLDCDGNYGSGDCKDLKDEHSAGMCSTFAKAGCGDTLPRVDIRGQIELPSSKPRALDPNTTNQPATSLDGNSGSTGEIFGGSKPDVFFQIPKVK